MRDYEVVPTTRDASGKALYLFVDWYLRKNRDEIRAQRRQAMLDFMLHGEAEMLGESEQAQ
jgi:hypothetical protein